MQNKMWEKIRQHQLWVNTKRAAGEELVLDEEKMGWLPFTDVNLEYSSIVACEFCDMDMLRWDFYRAALHSTVFKNMTLQDCQFIRAKLGYAEFHNVLIKDTSFVKAELDSVIFRNVVLENCNMFDVLASDADFRSTVFRNVNFREIWFNRTIMDETTVLENPQNLEEDCVQSINIGTTEEPILLKDKEAFLWLQERIVRP